MERLARATTWCSSRCPEDASAESRRRCSRAACACSTCPAPSGCATTALRARWYHAVKALPDGTAYGMAERDRGCARGAKLVACAGLLPDGGRAGARAAGAGGARLGRHHHRRQVRRLGRRQGADRADALLRSGREPVSLRRLRAPARRRDRAGAGRAGDLRAAPGAARPRHPRDDLRARAGRHDRGRHQRRLRARLQGLAVHPAAGRRAAGHQARGAHELLRHRLEAGCGNARGWSSSRASTTC